MLCNAEDEKIGWEKDAEDWGRKALPLICYRSGLTFPDLVMQPCGTALQVNLSRPPRPMHSHCSEEAAATGTLQLDRGMALSHTRSDGPSHKFGENSISDQIWMFQPQNSRYLSDVYSARAQSTLWGPCDDGGILSPD